jgi:hypothetical protein
MAVSRHSSSRRRARLQTCVVQPRAVCACMWKCSQSTTLDADSAGTHPAEKKARNPLLGGVCLLTTGGLIRVRCSSWYELSCRGPLPGPLARITDLDEWLALLQAGSGFWKARA